MAKTSVMVAWSFKLYLYLELTVLVGFTNRPNILPPEPIIFFFTFEIRQGFQHLQRGPSENHVSLHKNILSLENFGENALESSFFVYL